MSRIIIGRRVEAGPQGEHVQALIERLDAMTPDEAAALAAAARDAAWDAARDAAGALTVRDLISTERYDTLTRPWASVIGKVHPDD